MKKLVNYLLVPLFLLASTLFSGEAYSQNAPDFGNRRDNWDYSMPISFNYLNIADFKLKNNLNSSLKLKDGLRYTDSIFPSGNRQTVFYDTEGNAVKIVDLIKEEKQTPDTNSLFKNASTTADVMNSEKDRTFVYEYKYENGKAISEEQFNGYGKKVSECDLKYNSKGNLIQEKQQSGDGVGNYSYTYSPTQVWMYYTEFNKEKNKIDTLEKNVYVIPVKKWGKRHLSEISK